MIRKFLIYGFVVLVAVFVAVALTAITYADNSDEIKIKYEVKNIEVSWDNGIDGAGEALNKELKALSDENNCIFDVVPYETSSPQAQFPFSRTTSIAVIYNKCEKGNFVGVRKYVYPLENVEHFSKILGTINYFKYKPIFVPVVDQCGVLQTYAFGCTKWLLAVEVEK